MLRYAPALIAFPVALGFGYVISADARKPTPENAVSIETKSITKADVAAAQRAWGDGIVTIGAAYSSGEDYISAADSHVREFYAYGDGEVLFKPTLASADQFRGAFDEALSYFVGGIVEEDSGFAIAPYTKVRWENEATIISGKTAMSMGNYFFTRTNGQEVKVEYSFGYKLDGNDELKIILHHSSLPFTPPSSES